VEVDLDAPKAGEVLGNGACHSDSVIHGVLPHRRRVLLARRPSRDRRMGGVTARRLAAAHRLVQAKKLKLDELVTRTYALDDVNESMTAPEKGEVVRGVLVM
jgi:Zn-dependent alcohol dehydrogenase